MNANKLFISAKALQRRLLHTSTVRPLIQKWRQERGLPLNPNSYGVLTDKADYTYLDGKVTPYGMRQKQRIAKHRELAQKVIQLTKEVDFAVERHERLQKETEQRKQDILKSKLKPKGNLLAE